MATTSLENRPQLAPQVTAVLGDLRARIRRYVWLEGLFTALTWLGAAFWISLGIDWFFEPPPAARAVLLAVTGLVLLGIVIRLILLRLAVPMPNTSMATVLERRFPQLNDSLLTAVWLTGRPRRGEGAGGDGDHFNPMMLAHTCQAAGQQVGGVRLSEVFNPKPLRRSTTAAVLLAAGIVGFGAMFPEAMGVWARRSLLLAEELWPRKTHLEVEGFEDGVRKIARGADLDLVVRATADSLVIPEKVEIHYRTEGGARGREPMTREGRAGPGEDQRYAYTFESVLTPIRFDVVGGDRRIRDLRIQVVESPTVTGMALDCRYPDYMAKDPRTFTVTGVMQLPLGTRITVRAAANKELTRIEIDSVRDDEESRAVKVEQLELTGDRRGFRYELPPLSGDLTQVMTLFDADSIRSREPVRLALVGLEDETPQLAVQLDGVGTAITPQARLPMVGTITDDHGIDRVWAESALDGGTPVERALRQPPSAPSPAPTNLELTADALEVEPMELTPGQKLLVCVKAADRYDLGPSGPNVGTSERWLLDVVTPEQLRSMLEARELVLRQRFESILQEVTETRDLLARVDFSEPPAKDSAADEEPVDADAGDADAGDADAGDASDGDGQPAAEVDAGQPPEDPAVSAERRLALRRMRVERATQNCRKNMYETASVAESFDDIRKQLVNNRIDTEELKRRIEQGIAQPLHTIAEEMFPELERRLERLEASVADIERGPEFQQRAEAQADAILAAMEEVLERMLELESFNEAVEMLRLIIELQQDVDAQTKERLKQRLRELMED